MRHKNKKSTSLTFVFFAFLWIHVHSDALLIDSTINQISISQQRDVLALNTTLENYFSTRYLFYRAQRQDTLFYMGSATTYNPIIDDKLDTIKQRSLDLGEMVIALRGRRPAAIILSADDLNNVNIDQITGIAQAAFNSGTDIILIGTPKPFIKKVICDADYYERTDNKNALQITCFQPFTIRTLNGYGTQIRLDEPKRAFINIAKKPGIKSLDIGAGFGNVVLTAAYAGATDIHAWELDNNNVEALALAVRDTALKHHVHARQVDFLTYEVEAQDDEAYDVILISRVLHFFKPEDIVIAADKLFRLLKPGGILHVTAATVFMQVVSGYVPLYLERIKTHQPWPGYIDANYMKCYIDPEFIKILPKFMTCFDPIFPAQTFTKTGFEILKNDYFSRVDSHEAKIPLAIDGPYAEHRGTEAMWLILRKPNTVE